MVRGCLLHNVLVIVAVVPNRALIAERLRLANAPAVENLHVGGERPHLFRQRGAQLLLDVHGVVAFGDTDAIGDAQHMAIDGQPWHAERVPEDDICGFPADARKLGEELHFRRDGAIVVGDEPLRHADERFRFLAEETGRENHGFELARRRLSERARIGILGEERGRHHVHARVGRLRGEDRCHQQLERVPIMQLRIGAGMLLGECFDDSPRRLR